MIIGSKKEKLYQDKPNAIWYSDKKQICDLCGKESRIVIELRVRRDVEGPRVCFLNQNNCMDESMTILFEANPELSCLIAREIEYKSS